MNTPPLAVAATLRWRQRLRSWLWLGLAIWIGALLGGASAEPPTPPAPATPADQPASATATLALFDRQALEREAPQWQTAGGGTVTRGVGATQVIGPEIGLDIYLPAQPDAAVRRDWPAELRDWSAYPSLQLEIAAETAADLELTLTDATGQVYRQPLKLRAGPNRRQVLLTEVAKTLDLRQIHALALLTPAATADQPLTERRFRLLQLSLAPALSDMAQQIQDAWYFYYLSRYGYLAFFLILMAISMGVPLPEEIFHLSAGYLAYLTKTNPEVGINVHIIAPINMFSTLFGDCFIYWLGRTKGDRIRKWRWFKWVMPDAAFVKVREWFDRWGVGATFMFRFLPPIRMPGYFASGLLKQSAWTFFAADGLACLISVPTQIYLVYFYGDWIIAKIKEANFLIAVIAGVLVLGFIIYKLATRKKRAAARAAAEALMHSPEATAAIAAHNSETGIPILDGADASHIHLKHLNKEGSEKSKGADPAPAPPLDAVPPTTPPPAPEQK